MGNAEESANSDQEKLRLMEENRTIITFPDQAGVEETKEWAMSVLPPDMPGELKGYCGKLYTPHHYGRFSEARKIYETLS